jgi:hypothetical protein
MMIGHRLHTYHLCSTRLQVCGRDCDGAICRTHSRCYSTTVGRHRWLRQRLRQLLLLGLGVASGPFKSPPALTVRTHAATAVGQHLAHHVATHEHYLRRR